MKINPESDATGGIASTMIRETKINPDSGATGVLTGVRTSVKLSSDLLICWTSCPKCVMCVAVPNPAVPTAPTREKASAVQLFASGKKHHQALHYLVTKPLPPTPTTTPPLLLSPQLAPPTATITPHTTSPGALRIASSSIFHLFTRSAARTAIVHKNLLSCTVYTSQSRTYAKSRKMPPKKAAVEEKVLLGRPGNSLKSGIVCSTTTITTSQPSR